jgi:hypothetical protein
MISLLKPTALPGGKRRISGDPVAATELDVKLARLRR